MSSEHPLGDLAPRDVVARGVWRQMARGGSAFLDAREAVGEAFPTEFPNIHVRCLEMGVDARRDLIPVVPAAHYHMGGVDVDLSGRASIPGLWACGEVSSTGVHGANRLASNSLLEAVVFGKRVADSLLGSTDDRAPLDNPYQREDFVLADDPDPAVVTGMRKLMWDAVGLIREENALQSAVAEFQHIYEAAGPGRLRDRARICWALAEAARLRRESRGAHYRIDFPETDPRLTRHSRTVWDPQANSWSIEFERDLVA
jgi:L-aspartate oxidase